MGKMKVDDFIAKALYCEQLPTLYKLGAFMNKKQGKYLLCDCSGLIKGILWGYPNNGKYGSNGVPDINADTMIKQCTSVSSNMRNLKKGWLVWMKGHIGIYIGEGIVVESSPIWENGIQKTYCKGCGKENTYHLHERQWSRCGCFDKYIDYSKKNNQKVNVYYRVETQQGWHKEIQNLDNLYNNQNDPITAIAIRVDQGKIKYRVHVKGGKWLGWIWDYDIHNIKTGFAGNHQIIDAIQVYYYTPNYIRPYLRAKYKTNYGWQYDIETKNNQDGYAGIFGNPVTHFMIQIE